MPVMFIHGLPGSRLAWGLLPGDPFPPGIRVVAPDRPGYEGSDPKPGRSLLDWAGGVAALACACAFALPSRLSSCAVFVGPAPTDAPGALEGMSAINRFFIRLAWRAPVKSALNTTLVAKVIRRDPGRYIDPMQRKVHDADRAALAMPGVREMLVRDFKEALQKGARAWSTTSRPITVGPGGFL